MEEEKGRGKMKVLSSGVSGMRAGFTSMFNSAKATLTTIPTTTANIQQQQQQQRRRSGGGGVVEVYETEDLTSGVRKFQLVGGEETEQETFDHLPEELQLLFPDCSSRKWADPDWQVDGHAFSPSNGGVDQDGWTYGENITNLNFLIRSKSCHGTKQLQDQIRRRKLTRSFTTTTDSASSPTDQVLRHSLSDEEQADTLLPLPNSQQQSMFSKLAIMPSITSENDTKTSFFSSLTSTASSSSAAQQKYCDADDPFRNHVKVNHSSSNKAAQLFSGVRVPNMSKFNKDHTKDYQNLSLDGVKWLLKEEELSRSKQQSDEAIRQNTATLETRIRDAVLESKKQEEQLQQTKKSYQKDIQVLKTSLGDLVDRYKKEQETHSSLKSKVESLQQSVTKLRKMANEKDSLLNEDQRAINAEMMSANQALEEKAKALATARMRYKRDNKSLMEALRLAQEKKQEQEQHEKENNSIQPNLSNKNKELNQNVEKYFALQTKLEAVRKHRIALEEERKEMFNQVVEKKADLKLQSKTKYARALQVVDQQIQDLKVEQSKLIKRFTQETDQVQQQQNNSRRSEIRSKLSALKERRILIIQKQKNQEAEL